MTNADASKQRAHAKKRTWRGGGGGGGGAFVPYPPRRSSPAGALDMASALLAKCRSYGTAKRLVTPTPSLVDALPQEMVAHALAFLDGQSLLCCAAVCHAMAALTHSRDVWKNICMKAWPSLRTQVLPQLPGAPDYDLIRLYGGSWRRCFIERHRQNQRVETRVEIPQFASSSGVDKIVSDTFAIGEHHFCLWIFPNGNPNEPQYVGRVLSVYLVLTDLDKRPPSWLTCAVFSLSVINHKDPARKIEWHSCLVDNKFDSQLNNWGVHSLGSLKALRNPASGFLLNDTLTVTANVRLMSITFRVVFEKDLQAHRRLGLVDFNEAETLVLPFCCTLQDLLSKLHDNYGVDPESARVWCFNQPVVSGQALRPRKLLTSSTANKSQPLFGNLLCDGVDIDAYSFCQLYVENLVTDESVLNAPDTSASFDDIDMECCSAVSSSSSSTATIVSAPSPSSSLSAASSIEEVSMEEGPNASESSYLFVKVMDPETLELLYLGRFAYDDHDMPLTTSAIYECVARRLRCSSYELVMFKEEIAPTVFSGPIAWSPEPVTKAGAVISLQAADIVVFAHSSCVSSGAFASAMRGMLYAQYVAAQLMVQQQCSCLTLEQIEQLAERLDIPKFRVRSAFRKCHEDGRKTLQYVMEGRHLGFICDSCGETDFKGPRYNCSVCSDYDLCRHCHEMSHEVCHRYANVDGKWQRVYDFKDHKTSHAMREMFPVFHDYDSTRAPRGRFLSPRSAAAW